MENNQEKKATPGKIALAVAAVVLLAALLIGIIVAGLNMGKDAPVTEEGQTQMTQEATVPADGDPGNETCKGTYTASDDQVLAAADTVVATAGAHTLTNRQLQVYYWMEVQNFLSSYGSYAPYFGLDYTQPLDTQICTISESEQTWQQFFLAGALNSWQSYQAMAAEADANGYVLDAETQAALDTMEQTMAQNAAQFGLESAQALLAYNVGNAAKMEDYIHFMELYYKGMGFYNQQVTANAPTAEEIEAYFTENEQAYLDSGLSREDKYVDVRHVLLIPEGLDPALGNGESVDESAWEACRVQAEQLLSDYEQGDRSEDSFAQLAMEHSVDGSAPNGGLYTDVVKGQMVEAFENWCFDESRSSGDSGLVRTEYGYHLMYYVGDRPVWPEYAESDLINIRAGELLNTVVEKYPLEAEFEKILLCRVNLAGETETEEEPQPQLNEANTPVLYIAGACAAFLAAAGYVLNKKEHE